MLPSSSFGNHTTLIKICVYLISLSVYIYLYVYRRNRGTGDGGGGGGGMVPSKILSGGEGDA